MLPETTICSLSLLNLWKKRASPLSCLPMTALMLCNCIGHQSHKEKKITREKINKYIQYPATAISLVFSGSFYFMSPHPVSEEDNYFWTLTSVSPVCLQDKAVFIHTRVLSACPSAQPVGQYKEKQSHIHHVTTHLLWGAPSSHGNIQTKKSYKHSHIQNTISL